jgi:2'-5' RNA ligase
MRLFVSINLPNEVKLELTRIQKIFKKMGLIDANYVKHDNLHLTLKFIGNTDDNKLPLIIDALRQVEFNSFKTHLSNIGFFLNEGQIRILWATLAGKELFSLANKIECALEDFILPSNKEFLSHITIARVKSVKDQAKIVDLINHIKVCPLDFIVKNYSLISSQTNNNGPIYKELVSFSPHPVMSCDY